MVKQISQHQTQISSFNSIINKFRKTDDKIGNLIKDLESFLKNMKILRLKNTIAEIKKFSSLNSRLDTGKEKINDVEDKSVENI